MVGLGRHGQTAYLGARGLVGKCIGAGLDRMAAVPFDPSPTNGSQFVKLDQLAPQFLVLQLESATVPPAKPLPAKYQEPHSVDQQLRVRAQLDSSACWR